MQRARPEPGAPAQAVPAGTAAGAGPAVLRRLLDWDRAGVLAANRYLGYPACTRAAHCISRLGNGPLWALLLAALAAAPGPGRACALQLAAVTLAGLALYKALKFGACRPRPYVRIAGLRLCTAPLDEHSFPSGHTLHAVAFAVVITAHFPVLGLALIPFAVLTALVRVVLGLHYPSDVAAGIGIGAMLAGLSFVVFPLA